MSLASDQSIQPYAGNGVTSSFSVPFRVQDPSHLYVYTVDANGAETPLVLNTDYTLTNTGSYIGWSVNLIESSPNYGMAKPLASGLTLMLERRPPFTQDTRLRDQTSLSPSVLEDSFDYAVMLAKRVKDITDDLYSRVSTIVTQSVQAFRLMGSTSGYTDMTTDPIAGAGTVNLPAASGTEQVAYRSWVSSAISSALIYLAPFTGAVARTMQQVFGDFPLSVKWFGAVGDGVTNDTAAIQAALDACSANLKAIIPVYAPSGEYLIDEVLLPVGAQFFGAGGNLEDSDKCNTRFIQNSAVSPFRFAGYSGGNGYYYWHGRVGCFAILGKNTLASGFGLDARDGSGNGIIFTDQTLIENMTIRAMPEGGINLPHGALPLTIRNIKFLWNGGPGIKCTRVSQFQGVHFANISGDGNVGGLISLNGMSSYDNFLITSMKSECRVNSTYGGGAAQQANAIVISGSADVAIAIHGANHISSVPDGANYVKPGSMVYIADANIPTISWSGVAIRVRGTDTGVDPGVIEQSTNKVPYRAASGYFGNKDRIDRSTVNGVYSVFGTVDSYQAKSIEAPGRQIAGTTPAYSLYETDGAADAKAWLIVAAGGVLSVRTVSDDGTTTKVLAQFTRTQMQVGPDSSATYFRINGLSQTSAPAAGGASALPATPAGYVTVNINGTDRKIPYY